MPAEGASPTVRPLRADARRNRDLLLTSAREVFAQRGLDGPLEEVARRAGVSIGTLYNRFPTRADLVDAALADRVTAVVELAERALAQPDAWTGLVEHLTAIAEMQVNDRGFTEICVLTLPPDSTIEQTKQRGHQLFNELVHRAQRSGQLRADIETTDLGLLMWTVVRATDGIRAIAPDAWRRHLALLLDGLRASAAHPLPGTPLDAATVHRAMTFG